MTSRINSALAPLLVLVACAAAPQPAPAPAAPVAPAPVEISTIVVPIHYDLSTVAKEVEAQVPKTFAETTTERGFSVRYDVRRDPIRLSMVGAGLHANTAVHYALEACRGRFPCISCGFGEPRRSAAITLHTKLDWDPSWRIRSKTTPLPVHYPRRCEVTWFDFDITDRYVAPVVRQQLAIAARTIDRSTPAATNLRPQAQQIWTALQTPSELAPRTWLVLEPVDLALGPISGAGTTVNSTLALQARTRVVVGDKPAATTKPLPALKVAAVTGSGLRVPFDLELPYAEAGRLASAEFVGKTVQDVKVNSVAIARGASGKLIVEANVDSRRYKGIVRLEGIPRFDGTTLTVPDLEYSIDTRRRNPFFRLFARAAHEGLRQRLRESARFDLTKRLDATRGEITRALNRKLGNGVTLEGRADGIAPQSLALRDDAIVVRVVATGAARVVIR